MFLRLYATKFCCCCCCFPLTITLSCHHIPIVEDRTFNRRSSSFSVSLYSAKYSDLQFGEVVCVLVNLKYTCLNKGTSLLI